MICDRFADSTLAYQGYGGGRPLDVLRALADIATDGLRPTERSCSTCPRRAACAAERRAGTEQ